MENRRAVLKNTELEENSKEIVSKTNDSAPADESELKDKRFKCLDECLAKFPVDKRELIFGYYDTDEKTMIPTRKRLAEKVGISLNSLRIRVCRLKSKLENCTKECCEET